MPGGFGEDVVFVGEAVAVVGDESVADVSAGAAAVAGSAGVGLHVVLEAVHDAGVFGGEA